MEIHGGNEVAGNKFADEILTLRDRLFFSLTGPCRLSEKAIGTACWNVRFQIFEPSLTTNQNYN